MTGTAHFEPSGANFSRNRFRYKSQKESQNQYRYKRGCGKIKASIRCQTFRTKGRPHSSSGMPQVMPPWVSLHDGFAPETARNEPDCRHGRRVVPPKNISPQRAAAGKKKPEIELAVKEYFFSGRACGCAHGRIVSAAGAPAVYFSAGRRSVIRHLSHRLLQGKAATLCTLAGRSPSRK